MRDKVGKETLVASNGNNCGSRGWDFVILFNNLAHCYSINIYLAFTSNAQV